MSDISENSAPYSSQHSEHDNEEVTDLPPTQASRQQTEEEEEVIDQVEENDIPQDTQSTIRTRTKRQIIMYGTENTVEFLDRKLSEDLYKYRSKYTKSYLIREGHELLKYEALIKKYGLSREHLNILFDVVITLELGSFTKKLVDLLLPRDKVSEKMILQIIGKFSIKGIDLKLLNRLLIWSISVFEVVESIDTLRSFYGVLFHFLRFRLTRASCCHLLYYLTRKQNVTPYRVRKLTEMIYNDKNNAPLLGLLTVYKRFDNKIQVPINVNLSSKDTYLFTQPNLELACTLANIKSYWSNTFEEEALVPYKPELRLPYPKKRGSPINTTDEARPHSTTATKRPYKKKRTGADALSTMSFSFLPDQDISNFLKEIQDLAISKQLENVLDDRNIQHLVACNPEDLIIERLSYWIGIKIIELTRYNNSKDKGKERFQELLQRLVTLTRFAKSQLPIIESFLREYLKSWNGIVFQKEIFELITYIKPGDYDDLYQHILLPLYRKYYVSDVVWKAKLIDCYTDWLKNWALLDWKGHTRRSMEHDAAERQEGVAAAEEKEMDRLTTLFAGLSFDVNYFTTIQKLVEHVDRISVMGFLSERDHPLLQHASLSFFELVATIPMQHDIPEIIIPAANFVHRSFFSSHAMAVSRICGIVCRYKTAFVENEKKEDDWVSRHSSEYLGHFNTYMKDVCSALWRNIGLRADESIPDDALAFSLTRENIQKFTEICEQRGDEISKVLSITHSSALAGYSKRYMNSLEDDIQIKHHEPITVESLIRLEEQGGLTLEYQEHRVAYLDYLNEMGLTGIHDLLYACMTTLINRRTNRLQELDSIASRSRTSTHSQHTRQSTRSSSSSSSALL